MNPTPTAAGEPIAGSFDESWWARGLTPAERGSPAGARRPGWADDVQRAVLDAACRDPDSAQPDRPAGWSADWAAAFATVLRPFTVQAEQDLLAAVSATMPAGYADLSSITAQFVERLDRCLVRLAARTLVLELNQQRTAGRLAGSDGHQRFTDFVRQLSAAPALAAFLDTYPVLARLLAQTCRLATDAQAELLTRFAADRPAIVAVLLGRADPGPLLAVRAGQGDPHRGGRSVAVLSFAGQRLVYKPRNLDGQLQLNALIGRLDAVLDGVGLRTVAVLARRDYGWMEFVAAEPVHDPDGVTRFYRRLGALLALLRTARVTDIHHGNVLACGEHPALIDAETLLQPVGNRPASPDPAARALADSVSATGLLPTMTVAAHGVLDISGLGGDSTSPAPIETTVWDSPGTDRMRLTRRPAAFPPADNRPRLDGRVVEPSDHAAAVIDGYRLGYDAVLRHRPDFAELLAAAAGCAVRVVVRPTQAYASILDESTHPDLLRTAADRDAFLRHSLGAAPAGPLAARLVEHEIRDLWAGDVPCFAGRAGSRDLWASDGARLADVLDRDGVAAALDVLGGMAGPDRADQEWIISATLATRRPPPPPAGVATARAQRQAPELLLGGDRGSDETAVVAGPDQLLTAACTIADHLLARSTAFGGRLNWLGLELVDDVQWLVLPMGAGLGAGYCGVALFLAELAELTGVARYHAAAAAAVQAVPGLYEQLNGRPEWIAAVGCGGYQGFAGISYALARLTALLGAPQWREHAAAMVELTAAAIGPPGPPGIANGIAGCLLAMAAVHRELGLDSAARLAAQCADQLVDLVERTDGWCVADPRRSPGPVSFATGTAGIGWALSRGTGDAPSPRQARAADLALHRSRSAAAPSAPGWSAGLAGLLAAGTAADRGAPAGEADPIIATLAGQPVRADLSLAGGELGVAEALAMCAVGSPLAARAVHRRAALIVQAVNEGDFGCGVPDRVPTPGLLTGLAGIGHGLLRLGFASRVPSVLMLQPCDRTS